MRNKERVETRAAPPAAYAFSQGVRKGPILQVSGQGPVDPGSGRYLHPGDVAAQTTRVLRNITAILEAGGARFDDLIMLRVYLTDAAQFPAMNTAFEEYVSEHCSSGVFPARTTVFAGLPHPMMLVEIDGLAVLG